MLFRSESVDDEFCGDDDDSDEDFIVPEFELEKVRMLLKGREEIEVEIPHDQPKRKFCESHKNFADKRFERTRNVNARS